MWAGKEILVGRSARKACIVSVFVFVFVLRQFYSEETLYIVECYTVGFQKRDCQVKGHLDL